MWEKVLECKIDEVPTKIMDVSNNAKLLTVEMKVKKAKPNKFVKLYGNYYFFNNYIEVSNQTTETHGIQVLFKVGNLHWTLQSVFSMSCGTVLEIQSRSVHLHQVQQHEYDTQSAVLVARLNTTYQK